MVMYRRTGLPALEAAMSALIDVDQLRTFIAIVETGSFTKAAEVVHKTQSAVSMQMKRLEERLGKPIFARDGRASELTELCQPSVDLVELTDSNELDLAIITDCGSSRASEVFRRERLLWVTSNRHSVHLEEPLPLALGRPSCGWRRAAIDCLETMGRPHHIAYTSANASAVASAVLSGLAVSIFPESGLRPGMRVLNPGDGFPELPGCRVGLIRNPHESLALADALAEHIISSLDNLSEAAQAAE